MRRVRVVLVDEEPRERFMLAEMMRCEGFEVLSSAGCEAVISLFASCSSLPASWVSFVATSDCDVVVVDSRSRHARDTVAALRKHPETAAMPIVARGPEAGQLPVDGVIPHPWPRSGIAPVIVHALRTEPVRSRMSC